MLICLDCGETFDEPKHFIERHGLDTPPYEEFNGCPKCGGAYDDAVECDKCGDIVSSESITKFEGNDLCPDCWEEVQKDG